MIDFSGIPDRSNDNISAVRAAWFQTIKTYLVNFTSTTFYEMYATEDIAAAGDISHAAKSMQYRRVQGDGGAVTASNTPFGTTPTNFNDGMQIVLIGMSDVNTVTIERNDAQYGCLLNGDIVFFKGTVLTLIYDSTLERFVELGRNE